MILKYEEPAHRYLKLSEEYLPLKQGSRSMEVRHDLVDTEICIISKDVLSYFTDNFDYATLQGDFINSINSSEVIDDRILAYEVKGNSYYAMVADPRIYGEVSSDVIKRQVYPLVLDSKILCPDNNYKFASINKYFDSGV